MSEWVYLKNRQKLYVTTCYRCKMPLALEMSIYELAMARREDFSFYCPNGHQQAFITGETETDKLRRERDQLKQRIAMKDDEIRDQIDLRESAERRASAFKGQVTKLRRRAKAGICPCCSRHFENLHRHMDTQHPDYAVEGLKD